ncbi:MAG: SdrD B-like domain-containing protein, partial [Planctomycetota bacterium]
GNNSFQTIAINEDDVVELSINLISSGAVTGLKFTKTTEEVDCKDADVGPGPSFSPGDDVTFNYVVTNPGDVPLSNVVVTDDNATPGDPSDDFEPTGLVEFGKTTNAGDSNEDGLLDPGEAWLFTATVLNVQTSVDTYTNKADVVGEFEGEEVTDHDPANYSVRGIEIQKLTNGEDADTPETAAEIAPGDVVTWSYVVTNTGAVDYAIGEIEIVDDAGTPGDTSDDFSVSSGDITLDPSSDVGSDQILSPGEVWTYTASDIAADLSGGPTGDSIIISTIGNDPLSGPLGNSRTFTSDGVTIRTSAYSSRSDLTDFEDAYLGRYSSGLGVTDSSEGNGSNSKHRVDNIYRFNYVLFEFSETVVVDKVFLDSVYHDSDATFWVGTVNGDVSFDKDLLDSLVKETNNTTSNDARWADFNGGQVAGNVLVVAASVDDHTPEDKFKVCKVKFKKTLPGLYHNLGTLITDDITDSDPSNYKNPVKPPSGKIGNFVWNDYDRDGRQDSSEPGIPGVTVELLNASSDVVATTTTDSEGMYNFTGLESGQYKVRFIAPQDFVFTAQYKGSDADNGSNADPHTGKTDWIHIADHECDNTIDAGLYEKAVDKMFEAEDYDYKESPWKVYHSSSASGGEYIKAPNGSGSHYNSTPHEKSVKYSFDVHKTGNYELSARVLANSAADNSLWVRVNGGSWVQWHINIDSDWQWQTVTDGWDQYTTTFHLQEGTNHLEVKVREDGTKVDKWMVSKLSANTVVLDVADTTVNGDWVVNTDEYGNEYLVASNNAAHYSTPPEGSELSFNFSVENSGVFKMHALVNASDTGSNSFWVQINDGAWIQWHLSVTDGDWEWQTVNESGEAVDFHLEAGNHTLKIKVREGGAMLSKIVITDDEEIDLTLYG